MTNVPTNKSELNAILEQYADGEAYAHQEEKIGITKNEAIQAINKTYIKRSEVQKIRQGYDPNRLGSWVFIGDNARLENLDDLYWSYVMEVVAEHDPYSVQNGNYSLDYIKKNMKSASFGSVGIHKILARADQRAKERLKSAQTLATTLTRSDVVGMLPEKINDWLDDNNYEMQENASKWRVEGYNQAIDDMRNALGEGL